MKSGIKEAHPFFEQDSEDSLSAFEEKFHKSDLLSHEELTELIDREEYVIHAVVKDPSVGRRLLVVVSTSSWFQFDSESYQLLKKCDISKISLCQIDNDNPSTLKLEVWKSGTKVKFFKMRSVFSKQIDLSQFVDSLVLKCRSSDECWTLNLMIRKLVRDSWQLIMESIYMSYPSEVYQLHSHVVQKHKGGQEQYRVLAVSTSWLYCCDYSESTKVLKWALPMKKGMLHTIFLDDQNKRPALTLVFNSKKVNKYNKTLPEGDSHRGENELKDVKKFIFHTTLDRNIMVRQLQRTYFEQNNSDLKTFVIDGTKNLPKDRLSFC